MIFASGFEQRGIALVGTLIEVAAAVVVSVHAAIAIFGIVVRRSGSDRARKVIADGVLAALSFSVAGTLLKTIGLNDWQQIRLFVFVLVLRTLLKRVFQWEQRAMVRRSS